MQIALNHFGYHAGPTEGEVGARTILAVKNYPYDAAMDAIGQSADIVTQLAVSLSGEGFGSRR